MASKDIDIKQIWINFRDEHSLETKHILMLHYIWLVKFALQSMNIPTNNLLDDEDFTNIGILGLNEAIDRFEIERGVKFESFAIPRIKGMIQDELRKFDWLSRTARKKAHDFQQAGDQLRSTEGRDVSPEEIRKKLNLTYEEYESYLKAASAAKSSQSLSDSTKIHFEDGDEVDILSEIPDPAENNIQNTLENEERILLINNFLKKLPESKRLVITLYYYESLTFKEIGNAINVSESRVCQIHTQVIKDLREKLNRYDNA